MTIEASSTTLVIEAEPDHVRSEPVEDPIADLQGIAVFDGQQWSALCTDLDIATDGTSAEDALRRLAEAVAQATMVAHSHEIAAGQPTPEEAVHEFLLEHRGPMAAVIRYFRA